MKDIERFIRGFRQFQEDYYHAEDAPFEPLKQGQSPKTMLIGCSDSRVDPAILTKCAPGEIFVVRNVANLVPPCEQGAGLHGVSAALEYAVCHLEIEHLIILGHSKCGGIHALMASDQCEGEDCGFIDRWMSIAAPAKVKVLAELPGKEPKLQYRAVEQAAVLLSLENLQTFPWIRERVSSGHLALHGWYFDIEAGELLEYQPTNGGFVKIS